jgi:hypothetical protein
LDCHSAGNRIYDAWKLDEYAIPGGLHHSTVVGSDSRVGAFSADGLQGAQRAYLVHTHEATIANHIGCENGSEPSLSERLFWHVDRASKSTKSA